MPTRERIVALDKQLLWRPYTPMGPYIRDGDPVVVERAAGIYLFDKDGTRLMDGNGSWWVSLLGHNHPRLMAALRRQSETLAHCALAGMVHEPAVLLAERLLRRLGPAFARVFYSDDGSTAVEVALRMAFQYWQIAGRPEKRRFVSLSHSFHGETLGAASLSETPVFHRAVGPLLFDCIRLPSPGRPPAAGSDRPWYETAFAAAERIIGERAGEIAAVIVEPLVQGAAGMLVHPPQYLARLHALCRAHDVLLIADEVFVGYGRTGTFLAEEQAGVAADIVCLAKGFTGGVLPMAATAASDRVFQAFLGGPERTLWYGHSFTGNPLGAAVALEVLAVLEEERLVEGAGALAVVLGRGLEGAAAHPWVHDARQAGLIGAFTLAPPDDRRGADYLDEAGWRFARAARARGALLRPLGNVVYFVLPLNVTAAEIEELFDIVRAALADAFG